MKAKNGAYVKNEKEGNKEIVSQYSDDRFKTDQLELLADIIIDQYLESLYEQTDNKTEKT